MIESRHDELEALPFDQYSRQYIVSEIIKKLKKQTEKDKISIIDIGGHKGKTVEFQPEDDVTILDVFDEEYENYIKGDATKMSFPDNKFDISCSFDVFEHIPRKKRQPFINEALRVSKFGLFITMPIDDITRKVSAAETRLNAMYELMFGSDHRWLREHIDYGIPVQDEIEKLVKHSGARSISIPSNQIGDWQLLQMLMFAAARNPEITEDINSINSWYNENLMSIESSIDVGYRQIFFISKEGHNIELVQQIINEFRITTKHNDYVTINKETFDKFFETFARVTKKYNKLVEKYPQSAKSKTEFIKENTELRSKLAELKDYNEQITQQLKSIRNSSSWRITQPLRSVSHIHKKDV